ncbi:hypothetical protein [Gellertiella hungarica]|uniref:Uncharacterized protein n=1 Tax=Gellertiella hungarica TaxID=1572859 RepID=A0A7W6NKP8_9HYPH|nr:hypothetical protein [Gellertiella hungarica]MBB4064522.1 hypothetical protein [Gellertiella hungarica]
MSAAWRMGFLVSHLCQWVFIICLVKQYPFVDRSLVDAIGRAQIAPDTYAIAAQIGRFDLVSLLMTVLGIVLTLAGVVGFVEVRSRSESVAREAAGSVAARVAKETAENEIAPEGNRLIENFFDRKGIDLNKLHGLLAGQPAAREQDIANALDEDGGQNA